MKSGIVLEEVNANASTPDAFVGGAACAGGACGRIC